VGSLSPRYCCTNQANESLRQHVAEVAVLPDRPRAHRQIGVRIDEQLERKRRGACVPCHERGDRGDVATGAVATDGDASRIEPELRRTVGDPDRRRVASSAAAGNGCSGARR
jgi:hypothetical protein